jgi:hypothetical protein
MAETDFVHKHIVRTLRNAAGYSTQLPGGIWRSVAPAHVGEKRHVVMQYTDGLDVLASSGGYVGNGMTFLLKVIEASEDDAGAVAALDWLENILLNSPANGSFISGAYVWMDKRAPFALPVVENDTIWQQTGRYYTVFVDTV